MDTHIKPRHPLRRSSDHLGTGHEGWLTHPPAGAEEPLHIPVVRHNAPHPLRSIKEPRSTSAPQRVARAKPLPPKGCSGAWGSCISHPDCPDTNCEGHPHNQPEPDDFDPALRAHFWRLYVGAMVAVVVVLVLAALV